MISSTGPMRSLPVRDSRTADPTKLATPARSSSEAEVLANQPGTVSFSDVLAEAVDGVRTAYRESGEATNAAMLGRGTPHEAMVAMSKAGLAFRFMTQTRNKVIEAYREMMNLQM